MIPEVCGGAKLPAFRTGHPRHSVAVNAGPAQARGFLGHKSPRTEKRLYGTHAAPPKIPTLA